MKRGTGKQLWTLTAAEWAYARSIGASDDLPAAVARQLMGQYKRTGNGAHAWRAWCISRLLETIPPDLDRQLKLFMDEVAADMVKASGLTAVARAARMSTRSGARGDGNKAFIEQSAGTFLESRFKHLLKLGKEFGQGATAAAVHERLAIEQGTSAAAIKQRLLRISRKGQHAKRSRKVRD